MFLNIFGNLLIFVRRKEVAKMAVIYVALIIKGKEGLCERSRGY